MLKSIAFANAVTAVSLVLYVVCRLLAQVAPGFLFKLAQSWFHTVDLTAIQATSAMDLGTFIFGGVTLAILSWVTTYAAIELYSRWAK